MTLDRVDGRYMYLDEGDEQGANVVQVVLVQSMMFRS